MLKLLICFILYVYGLIISHSRAIIPNFLEKIPPAILQGEEFVFEWKICHIYAVITYLITETFSSIYKCQIFAGY